MCADKPRPYKSKYYEIEVKPLAEVITICSQCECKALYTIGESEQAVCVGHMFDAIKKGSQILVGRMGINA